MSSTYVKLLGGPYDGTKQRVKDTGAPLSVGLPYNEKMAYYEQAVDDEPAKFVGYERPSDKKRGPQ